jgi:hypothetical protein
MLLGQAHPHAKPLASAPVTVQERVALNIAAERAAQEAAVQRRLAAAADGRALPAEETYFQKEARLAGARVRALADRQRAPKAHSILGSYGTAAARHVSTSYRVPQ